MRINHRAGTVVASPSLEHWGEALTMNTVHTTSSRLASWLESEYCASVAATMLARTEYFELLEDAMVSSARLAQALTTWREHASHAEVIGGLVGTA
jgi:hypothetical protein